MPTLSERELRRIIAWVATQTRDPVWLIRVKPGDQGRRVIAYIVPDEMTPRMRVGRVYSVPESKRRTGILPPGKYFQISMPDHVFTEQFLEPSLSELPFEWAVFYDPNGERDLPMSKEEVFAIVDFVHEPSSDGELMAKEGASGDDRLRGILQLPVFQVERAGNQIEVQFGYMHGLMWGYGLEVTLEHTPTGYRVKTWGEWIS
jgi:hypothetical protein